MFASDNCVASMRSYRTSARKRMPRYRGWFAPSRALRRGMLEKLKQIKKLRLRENGFENGRHGRDRRRRDGCHIGAGEVDRFSGRRIGQQNMSGLLAEIEPRFCFTVFQRNRGETKRRVDVATGVKDVFENSRDRSRSNAVEARPDVAAAVAKAVAGGAVFREQGRAARRIGFGRTQCTQPLRDQGVQPRVFRWKRLRQGLGALTKFGRTFFERKNDMT